MKEYYGHGLCLACTNPLEPETNTLCNTCHRKVSYPFIMEWTTKLEWIDIKYSQLKNIQQMTLLRHGCTHIAKWLEPTANEWTNVMLKEMIIDRQDALLFDFDQVN